MELSQRQLLILEEIERLIRNGAPQAEAAKRYKIMTGEDAIVDEVMAFRQSVAETQRIWATQRGALFDAESESSAWYTGPQPNDIFWPDLESLLAGEPKWRDAVPSLDKSSTDIVGLLADPHSPTIRTRGLVLGHVQSGKTANFTATIAKAADAGYRLFIVLSGVHNSLRRQTQLRIDEQLIERSPTRWIALTDESRDFGKPVKALPLLSSHELRLIAVVKKNVSRLTLLRNWLQEANRHGGLDTAPILIIDDESDQASPNAARSPELDRTKINLRITELLEFPRVAYVGYTATPFANVLVNPRDLADIYPRHFIYSLPKPPTYFGSRELFGQAVSEEEATIDDAPHDLIRIVPDAEAERHSLKLLREAGPEVTESLGQAISWFILATAARRTRAGKPEHSSMLVHTTMRVTPQLEYLEPIRGYIKKLSANIQGGNLEDLREMWDLESPKEPASRHGLDPVPFDALKNWLLPTIAELKVLADNGESTDRLIYNDEPATVIAVGGNTLSRGLTLEGLVSSFFLRGSNTYDTLLQMGRWFGYRPGYADLPRIWTTKQLANDFRFLADVEDSIRSEIERYRTTDGASPSNLPVRIRLHPKMQATAKVKMYFAVRGDASYSAQRPQTTYFAHKNMAVINGNLDATRRLVIDAKSVGLVEEPDDNRTVIRNVDAGLIETFIKEYAFHEDSELNSSLLLKYIATQRAVGALDAWNLAILGVKNPSNSIDLGLDVRSPLITRSKLHEESDNKRAVIGTLMSRPDRVADLLASSAVKRDTNDSYLQQLRDAEGRGLLVIYPIDKDSAPQPGSKLRENLSADGHLIGVAFCFPTAARDTEPTDTIQVDLSGVQAEIELESDDGRDEQYEDTEGSHDEVHLDH